MKQMTLTEKQLNAPVFTARTDHECFICEGAIWAGEQYTKRGRKRVCYGCHWYGDK